MLKTTCIGHMHNLQLKLQILQMLNEKCLVDPNYSNSMLSGFARFARQMLYLGYIKRPTTKRIKTTPIGIAKNTSQRFQIEEFGLTNGAHDLST